MVGAGYRIEELLDMPVTGLRALSASFRKRMKRETIQRINETRIAGMDHENYRKALGEMK